MTEEAVAPTVLDDAAARRVLARLQPTRHPLFPWFDDATAMAHARTEALF